MVVRACGVAGYVSGTSWPARVEGVGSALFILECAEEKAATEERSVCVSTATPRIGGFAITIGPGGFTELVAFSSIPGISVLSIKACQAERG